MRVAVAVYRIGRAVVVLLIGFAVMAYLVRTKPKPDSVDVENKGILVETLPATPRNVQFSIPAYGAVEPKRLTRIVPEVAGRIVHKSEKLQEGNLFEEGQVLLRIDPSEYRIRVQEVAAQIAQLNAEAVQLKAEFENAQALQEWSERDVQLAKQELERSKTLLQRKIISQEDVDKVEKLLVQATTALQTTQNTLRLFPARQELLQARTAVSSATLDQAQLRLDRTEIKAPYTGRILDDNVEVGQYVQPGTELLQIWDTSAVEVRVNLQAEDVKWILPRVDHEEVKEWVAGRLIVDDPLPSWLPRADVTVRMGNDRYNWKGYVRGFEGRMDTQTRTLPAVIEVPDPWKAFMSTETPPLVPGIFCHVEIEGREMDDVFVLPRSSVQIDETVWVAEKGRLRRRGVELLRVEKQLAYVLPSRMQGSISGGESGNGLGAGKSAATDVVDPGRSDLVPLQKGDLVIVSQLSAPTDGAPVRMEQTTATLQQSP